MQTKKKKKKKGLNDSCDLCESPGVCYVSTIVQPWMSENIFIQAKSGCGLWYPNKLVFSLKSQGMHKRQNLDSTVKTEAAEAEVLQLLLLSVVEDPKTLDHTFPILIIWCDYQGLFFYKKTQKAFNYSLPCLHLVCAVTLSASREQQCTDSSSHTSTTSWWVFLRQWHIAVAIRLPRL